MNTRIRILSNQNPSPSSIYPLHPEGTQTLLRISGSDLTWFDRCVVAGSSVFVVGAFAWVPALYWYAWRKWKSIPSTDQRRKRLYLAIVVGLSLLLLYGPHRSHRFGRWIRVRKWKLWMTWLKFIAMEVITDNAILANDNFKMKNEQVILAFVPHGIFPFAFAFGILPEVAQQVFGCFRPVVATATNFLPVVNDFLLWLGKIDASRATVDKALSNGDRIGIVPGGIAEIFEGYPKRGTKPDVEYSIVRKGFLQLAHRHNIPVIPIYCFGSTKMFRRWNLPLLEKISSLIRASVVVFYGVWGLPIPFRHKLLYVIGNPIRPPTETSHQRLAVESMHDQFCNELHRIFDRHKEAYGWGHKSLQVLSR